MGDVLLYPRCLARLNPGEYLQHDMHDPALAMAGWVNEINFDGETIAVHSVVAYTCPVCGEQEDKAIPEDTMYTLAEKGVLAIQFDAEEISESLWR